MKLSSILTPVAASLLLAGCGSLDNPLANLFHGTGRDARVYNAQTGQWEYPPEKREQQQKKSQQVAAALAASSTPAPHGFNDTRYWDAQRNEWVEGEQTRSSSSSTPARPKPAPPAAESTPAPVVVQAAPPPRPAHATGVYNSSTGKIEWKNDGEAVPSAAPGATGEKHWYWPF